MQLKELSRVNFKYIDLRPKLMHNPIWINDLEIFKMISPLGDLSPYVPNFTCPKDAFIGQIPDIGGNIDDCIFCEPDPSRLLLETSNFMVIAGAGPIIPGYSIIFPKEHISSFSCLKSDLLEEFSTIYNWLLSSFDMVFGEGHTAYEHGGIGSCLSLESYNIHTSYCFHAHMVFIPKAINIYNKIIPYFNQWLIIDSLDCLSLLNDRYVYYEYRSGLNYNYNTFRHVLMNPKTIYSQFMRKNISYALNVPERWNWLEAPNWGLVYDTIKLLRPALNHSIHNNMIEKSQFRQFI